MELRDATTPETFSDLGWGRITEFFVAYATESVFVACCASALVVSLLIKSVYNRLTQKKFESGSLGSPDEDKPLLNADEALHNNEVIDPAVLRKFKRFKLRYLTVLLCSYTADYIAAAYVYTMFSDFRNLPENTARSLVSKAFIASTVASATAGIWDIAGRRAGMVVIMLFYVLRYGLVAFSPENNISLLVIAQICFGFGRCWRSILPDCWVAEQHRILGFPDSLLQDLYSAGVVGYALIAVIACNIGMLTRHFVGYEKCFVLAMIYSAFTLILTLCLWEENYGRVVPSPDGDATKSTSQTSSVEEPSSSQAESFQSPNQSSGLRQSIELYRQLTSKEDNSVCKLLKSAVYSACSDLQFTRTVAYDTLNAVQDKIASSSWTHAAVDAGYWIFGFLYAAALENLAPDLLYTGFRFVYATGSVLIALCAAPVDKYAAQSGTKVTFDITGHTAPQLSLRAAVALSVGLTGAAIGCMGLAVRISSQALFLCAAFAANIGYGGFLASNANLRAQVIPARGRLTIACLFNVPAGLGSSYIVGAQLPLEYTFYAAAALVLSAFASGVIAWGRSAQQMRKQEKLKSNMCVV